MDKRRKLSRRDKTQLFSQSHFLANIQYIEASQSEKDKKDFEHCSYKYCSDSDMKYHMMIDHWYKRCDQCKQIFSDRKQLKEHMKKESHSNIIEENTTDDEDLDVSIDEERMERLQADVDANECA